MKVEGPSPTRMHLPALIPVGIEEIPPSLRDRGARSVAGAEPRVSEGMKAANSNSIVGSGWDWLTRDAALR